MPPGPTVPISNKGFVRSDVQSTLTLPAGMTAAQAWDIHSMPDLLHNFGHTSPVQLVPHRGIPEYPKAIPDGSIDALRRAVISGNIVELDPLWITEKPYVMFEDREALFEESWFPRYVPAQFPVTPLCDCMYQLVVLNWAMTIFLDGRNQDGGKLVALLSNEPVFHNNAIVQIHPYAFRNGSEFVDMVQDLNAASDWRRTVAVVPVLDPDTLPTLAGVGRNSLDYGALYAAGKAWLTSMIERDMRIFGLGFPVSGIGHGVNVDTGETHDLIGEIVTEPRVKRMFLWDRVLLDLVKWAKQTHPVLAIIMHSIMDGYSFDGQHYVNTSYPMVWPEGAESHGRELIAVPGNALKHGADIVICDRVIDNINAALGTRTYTWPTDVDFPTLHSKLGEAEHGVWQHRNGLIHYLLTKINTFTESFGVSIL